MTKHNEAGKGSKQRPTNKEAFDEAFDRIFRNRVNEQKLSSDDMLNEYELNKSTGEIQVKDAE